MPQPIGSVVTAALLVALAMTISGSVRAAADCIAAPNSQLPQGGHWYYHVDRTTGRKCWYMGPQDRKAHALAAQEAAPHTQPTTDSPARLSPDATSDRLTLPTQVAEPTIPAWPMTTPGNMTQAGTFPPERIGANERDEPAPSTPVEPEGATTDVRGARAQSQQPIMAAAEIADPMLITPVRLLLVVMAGLAAAGILLRPLFKIVTPPQSAPNRFDADLTAVIAAARRAAPPLPPPYSPSDYAGAQARSDEEPKSLHADQYHLLEGVEQALLGVLRDWERPAASTKKLG